MMQSEGSIIWPVGGIFSRTRGLGEYIINDIETLLCHGQVQVQAQFVIQGSGYIYCVKGSVRVLF